MEDEHGAAGQGGGGGGGVTAPPLSGNLQSESPVENMGGDNQVHESFEEGSGEEIMVEVVGSDVYVDGVSGQKEGHFESAEIGDSEGHVLGRTGETQTRDCTEAMDVSNEGDVNKVGEGDPGSSGTRGEKFCIATEEVDISFSKSGDVEGDAVSASPATVGDAIVDEVRNPGIEAMGGTSSAATEEVTEPSPMVIDEEKKAEDEAVKEGSTGSVNHEPSNHPAEAVFEEKTDIEEKNEVLTSTDISETKEAVFDEKDGVKEKKEVLPSTDDSANHEPLNHPAEAVFEEKTAIEETNEVLTSTDISETKEAVSDEKDGVKEKKPVLPSTDDSASHDHLSAVVSVPTDEVTGLSPMVINEEKSSEEEAVTKDSSDLATPESPNHPAEAVSEDKAEVAEKKEVLPVTNYSASRDEFVGDSVMPHGETESAHGGLEPADLSLNPNSEGTKTIQVDGTDSVREVHLDNTSSGGEILDSSTEKDDIFRIDSGHENTGGSSGIDDKFVDEREVFVAENKDVIVKPDSGVSNVQDENESCLNEFHSTKLESNDQSCGVSHAGLESIRENSIGNNECSKADGDVESNKVHDNQVSSNERIHLIDRGDTDVVETDKCPNVGNQDDDRQKNNPNVMSLSYLSDKEIAQEDSSKHSDQPFITTAQGAQTDAQDAAISQGKVVDCGGSSEKGDEINSEIQALDDSAENVHLPEEGACSKVETDYVTVTEDHAICDNPVVNSEGFENVVNECGPPQEVSVQTTETSNDEVGKIENTNLTPNEVLNVAQASGATQVCLLQKTETAELTSSSNEVYESKEEDHEPRESNGFCINEGHATETKVMDVEEEGESDRTYRGGEGVDEELGTGGSSESDKLKSSNEEAVKYVSSLRVDQSGYFTPLENEGPFAQSDLVWGKVRSHPWWPGQIFDPADASEKALKYHKKDSYLVAYFGDQTFAWNDSSALKPFRSHFSQIEKQSNSEAFQNAVSCALEEVERRVELGLACSCIPKDAYAKIETQFVENAGIREEASQRYGVDQSSQASHFEPDKLLDFVTDLAPRASLRIDQLDLVIARAQLSALCQFKGYRSPTEFPSSGELLESDVDTEKVSDDTAASHKRKHTPKYVSQSRNERNSVESMGDREYSLDADDDLFAEDHGRSVSLSSGKKRKAVDHPADGSDRRVTVYAAKASTPTGQTPKPSFRIGECIRRVASQLTGATSSLKGSNDEMLVDGSANIYEQSEKQNVVSVESLSVNEMLTQLELVAQDPKKRHNVQINIRAFFLGFRSSIALNRRGRKKKSEQAVGGSGEDFEFDDVNDSYWTDRIVQNYSEDQLQHESESGSGNHQLVPFGGEKPVKAGRRSHSRKRFSSGVSPTATTEEDQNAKRRKQESSPAELILTFAERNRVPSEINLNKMFRRFGPLMESETEADHESGCAKVIFKRGADAEVARNSAEKFNIFGPVAVNYEIGYSPVISVKILPVAIPQPQEDATLML